MADQYVSLEDLANPEKVSELLVGVKWGNGGERPQIQTIAELAITMTHLPDILEEWAKVPPLPANVPAPNRTFVPTEITVANTLSDIAADALIGAAKLLIALAKDTPLTETDREQFEAGVMHQFGALLDETFILGSIQQERRNLTAGMFTNN
jgi:hypothetical protein